VRLEGLGKLKKSTSSEELIKQGKTLLLFYIKLACYMFPLKLSVCAITCQVIQFISLKPVLPKHMTESESVISNLHHFVTFLNLGQNSANHPRNGMNDGTFL
jgi:hypothetical protein